MDFEEVLAHHILDHRFASLAKVGMLDIGITRHVIMLWSVAAISLALFSFAAHSSSRVAQLLKVAVEAIISFIREDILEPILGHSTDKYLPYFVTLFFFILISNLLGLVPGAATSTGNISVTAALALCTFGLIQFAGISEYGVFTHIKQIVPHGLPIVLVPLLFVIEILGLFAKCFALCIRLFANMIAGHIVSLAFLSLIFIFAAMNKWIGLAVAPVSVGLALFVYCLDLLVALLQAYIFTMLTAIFVGGAVHPH